MNFLPRWTAVNNSELHSTGAPTSQCLLLLSLSQKQNVRNAASPWQRLATHKLVAYWGCHKSMMNSVSTSKRVLISDHKIFICWILWGTPCKYVITWMMCLCRRPCASGLSWKRATLLGRCRSTCSYSEVGENCWQSLRLLRSDCAFGSMVWNCWNFQMCNF